MHLLRTPTTPTPEPTFACTARHVGLEVHLPATHIVVAPGPSCVVCVHVCVDVCVCVCARACIQVQVLHAIHVYKHTHVCLPYLWRCCPLLHGQRSLTQRVWQAGGVNPLLAQYLLS